MKIGSALPENVLRLEYGNYIEEDFGYPKLGISRGGFLCVEKNVEGTNIETKLKTLWTQVNNNITEHPDDIELFKIGEDIPYIFAYSNVSVGWWKFRIKLGGAISSERNEIIFIEEDTSNYLLVSLGINNVIRLQKEEGASRSTIINTDFQFTNNVWYEVEVTRDIDGNLELFVDTVSQGTAQDDFSPTPKLIKILAMSDRSLFISNLEVDYNRPT